MAGQGRQCIAIVCRRIVSLALKIFVNRIVEIFSVFLVAGFVQRRVGGR